MNNISKANRMISKEEVNKILIDISKYLYLGNFNITLTNKINQNGKIVVSYKVSGSKFGEKIMVQDVITL